MGSSLLAFAVLGVGLVDASATFDGAKWELGRRIADMGYPAGSIDGGFEWFGFHQPGPMAPARPIEPGTAWWVSFFEEGVICANSQNADSEEPGGSDADCGGRGS